MILCDIRPLVSSRQALTGGGNAKPLIASSMLVLPTRSEGSYKQLTLISMLGFIPGWERRVLSSDQIPSDLRCFLSVFAVWSLGIHGLFDGIELAFGSFLALSLTALVQTIGHPLAYRFEICRRTLCGHVSRKGNWRCYPSAVSALESAHVAVLPWSKSGCKYIQAEVVEVKRGHPSGRQIDSSYRQHSSTTT